MARGDPAGLIALGRQALRSGDARAAAAQFHDALALDPAHPEARELLSDALFRYGHELRQRGALEAAAAAYAHAAQNAPDNADAWLALGNACMEAQARRIGVTRADADAMPGEDYLSHAVDAFARAAQLRPDAPRIAASLAMARRYACDWAAPPPAITACEPMTAVALVDDARLQRSLIEDWTRANLPVPTPPAAPAVIRQRGTRLRVGYLSTDFHDHATAHLAAGLFELHDRSRIEAFAYAGDRDDGSDMRRRLRAAFEHWRDVREMDDATAARAIAADALDVLVDLKGHSGGTRIEVLAHRPAPVQLHYLGFPGTIGYAAVDAIVADEIVAPAGSDGEFAERVLRLPRCYQANDHRRVLPPAASRAQAGLPERGLVLACFNQTYKMTEPFVRAWLDVLREHDDAVLWLGVPYAPAQRNLRVLAQSAGVDEGRLIFAPMLPQAAHLARLRCADVALDVLPYGSHTTGSDALFAGVPLVTCRGTTFAGRVGASLCAAAGLPDLVAETPGAYATLLRALCADRGHLAHCRDHLERGRATLPLFDTASFTRDFEALLEQA